MALASRNAKKINHFVSCTSKEAEEKQKCIHAGLEAVRNQLGLKITREQMLKINMDVVMGVKPPKRANSAAGPLNRKVSQNEIYEIFKEGANKERRERHDKTLF